MTRSVGMLLCHSRLSQVTTWNHHKPQVCTDKNDQKIVYNLRTQDQTGTWDLVTGLPPNHDALPCWNGVMRWRLWNPLQPPPSRILGSRVRWDRWNSRLCCQINSQQHWHALTPLAKHLCNNIFSICTCLSAICWRFTTSLSPISMVKESSSRPWQLRLWFGLPSRKPRNEAFQRRLTNKTERGVFKFFKTDSQHEDYTRDNSEKACHKMLQKFMLRVHVPCHQVKAVKNHWTP